MRVSLPRLRGRRGPLFLLLSLAIPGRMFLVALLAETERARACTPPIFDLPPRSATGATATIPAPAAVDAIGCGTISAHDVAPSPAASAGVSTSAAHDAPGALSSGDETARGSAAPESVLGHSNDHHAARAREARGGIRSAMQVSKVEKDGRCDNSAEADPVSVVLRVYCVQRNDI